MTVIPTFVQQISQTANVPNVKSQTSNAGDFGKVLEKQKTDSVKADYAKEENPSWKEKPQQKTSKVEDESTNNDLVKNRDSATKASETDDGMKETKTESVKENDAKNELTEEEQVSAMEALQTAMQKMEMILQERLGLSEEELGSLMERLNITAQDILADGENLTQLLLENAGAEDSSALLTDENLFENQKFLQEQLGGIQNDLKSNPLFEATQDKNLFEENEQKIDAPQSLDPSVGTGITFTTGQQNETAQFGREDKRDDREDSAQGQNLAQSFMTYAANGREVQDFSQVRMENPIPQMTTADPQNVTGQVLDYLKIHLGDGEQEINMQLHPETLGTLQVQISAKEGVMTAHFTTANEEVKNILENQMVLLKENFEEQNIKVEAIEISVQTQGFDENLEQGRERDSEQQTAGRRRRTISLEDLNAGASLEEDEQLIAEMMIANGNTVDYQA